MAEEAKEAKDEEEEEEAAGQEGSRGWPETRRGPGEIPDQTRSGGDGRGSRRKRRLESPIVTLQCFFLVL